MTAIQTQPTTWLEDFHNGLFVPTPEQIEDIGQDEKPEHLVKLLKLALDATKGVEGEPFAFFVAGYEINVSDSRSGNYIAAFRVPYRPDRTEYENNYLYGHTDPPGPFEIRSAWDLNMALGVLQAMDAHGVGLAFQYGKMPKLAEHDWNESDGGKIALALGLELYRQSRYPIPTVVRNKAGSWMEPDICDAAWKIFEREKEDTKRRGGQ